MMRRSETLALQRRLRPLVWSPQASSACVRQARRLAGQRLLKKPGECGRKKSSPSRSCRRAFSRARSAERLQVLQGRRSSITGAKSPPTSADWAALACSSKMGAEFHSRNARHKGHLQVSCGPRSLEFGLSSRADRGRWPTYKERSAAPLPHVRSVVASRGRALLKKPASSNRRSDRAIEGSGQAKLPSQRLGVGSVD